MAISVIFGASSMPSQQQHRHPRERRNRAQRLERRFEQRVDPAAQAHRRADDERESGARRKPRRDPQRTRADMTRHARDAEAGERVENLARGGDEMIRQPALSHDDLQQRERRER